MRRYRLPIDIEVLDEPTLDPEELRKQVRTLVALFVPERTSSRMAAIRQELGDQERRSRAVAEEAPRNKLHLTLYHPVERAFAVLDRVAGARKGAAGDGRTAVWADLAHR